MKKNKKVLLVVFGLLIGVSISFAYFVGRSLTSGSGASLTVKTATLNGTKIEVEGELFFNDGFIYPGHTKVSSIKVTATGNNELIPYNLIWKGINSLYTSLNYKVYKSDKKIEVEASCEKKREIRDGKQLLHEVCNISNLQELGKEIYTGTIERSENNTKIILAEDEFITSTEEGKEIYYYVVIEYPNNEDIENNQNQDIGEEFSGEVTVEKSETNADINIMAVYIEDENGDYKKSDTIPQGEYTIDRTKSSCDKGATPSWDNDKDSLLITNLKESGTKCYLYFKKILTSKDTLDKLSSLEVSNDEIKCPKIDNDGYASITQPSTEEGTLLCKSIDDDGETYYFRGKAENNWVKIGETYWRIIRINGDSSIRLIYSGKISPAMYGPETEISTNQFFNAKADDNAYVGFMYGKIPSSSYDEAHTNTTPSDILKKLKTWYEGNDLPQKVKDEYIDENAGFCGDKMPYAGTSSEGGADKNNHGYGIINTFYGSYVRINSDKKATFKCLQIEQDLYTTKYSNKGNKKLPIPVGLITADEVMYAGTGYGDSYGNTVYYLYTGQYYWTMSPISFYSDNARVLNVHTGGFLQGHTVNSEDIGLRPVVNLSADTPFAESIGNSVWGSSTNPFVVDLN